MRALGSRPAQANAIVGLGVLRRVTGAGRLRRALEIFQRIGSGEAAGLDALPRLGRDCRPATPGA